MIERLADQKIQEWANYQHMETMHLFAIFRWTFRGIVN